MSLFTEEQLQELAVVFGLSRVQTYQVRDGLVRESDFVWWRSEEGPRRVKVSEHLENLRAYPEVYQVNQPSIRVEYPD